MNGEDLANKAGIKKENRFFFSDSYYENMPEIPDKPNFDPIQPPKKEDTKPKIENKGNDLIFGRDQGLESREPLFNPSSNWNSSVQQASSFDQIINNDYSNNESQNQNNFFNFFSHQANTSLPDTAPEMEDATLSSPIEEPSIQEKSSFFDRFGSKKRKKDELDVVHVGTDFPVSDLPMEENSLNEKEDFTTSFSQTNSSGDSFTNQENFKEEQNFSSFNLENKEKDGSLKNLSMDSYLENSNFRDFLNTDDSHSIDLESQNSFEPFRNSISMRNSENEKVKESATNQFSYDNTNSSSDFYQPKETPNSDFFFGSTSNSFRDIENDKATIIQMTNEVEDTNTHEETGGEMSSIDFIDRLKNQETKEEDNTSDSENSGTGSQFGFIYQEPEEKKSFLWEPLKKTPIEEIKVPERKLEYDSYYMDDSPKENQFIIGDTSVEVERQSKKQESAKIPDFMSGTIHNPDLNIETGINQELEAELLRQREEEEERRRLENSEYNAYRDFASGRVRKEMVYKAGGKSYVREVIDQPKIKSEIKQTLPVEVPDIKEEETPKKEPRSIQELIESIVDVPGLSNIEVKLDPFENPGVKFGFKEKVDKKEIVEDQPTNVYDEKKDNFDYDQNFENVEVVKSTLLEDLIEKTQKEGRISVLARYGEDFCARDYITNPAIGRADEIKQLILILLTPEKSGILVGKPGIGKTSIVEGLAYQLQRNNVPDALKGFRIVSVKTSSLLGSLPTGETRLQTLVDELKELDKIILFIDEIHMLVGATNESAMDFANMFKESLGRGSIKIIGATTTEEYERYILRDKAFVRRFQKVEVEEPSREHTIKILMGTLPKIEKTTGAKLKYSEFMKTEIMSFIVDITTEYKRIYGIGSRYPDICLTLLSQAFSQAVFANRTEVTIHDIRKAIENSKNIYPDVIRKELVNFDRKFKDLIQEE